MSSLRKRLSTEISESAQSRNVRGTLAKLIAIFPVQDQHILACEFAQRTLDNCPRLTSSVLNEALADESRLLKQIKAFVIGECGFDEVIVARERVYLREAASFQVGGVEQVCHHECVQVVFLVTGLCCQRELEKRKLVLSNRFVPDAIDVAHASSYAAGRFVTGIDWDSDIPDVKRAARDRGRAASDAETRWQIAHLTDYVEKLPCLDKHP